MIPLINALALNPLARCPPILARKASIRAPPTITKPMHWGGEEMFIVKLYKLSYFCNAAEYKIEETVYDEITCEIYVPTKKNLMFLKYRCIYKYNLDT